MNNSRKALGHAKPYLMIFLITAVVLIAQSAGHMLDESRTWRDATRQTPFSNVQVDSVLERDASLLLAGTMVKVRCEFVSLSAYVVGSSGKAARVPIDTSPEEAIRPGGSRPPTPEAQYWGPWLLKPLWKDVPVSWAVYAHHLCPGEDTEVVNMFASGLWPERGGK